jgi:hypothetical protein
MSQRSRSNRKKTRASEAPPRAPTPARKAIDVAEAASLGAAPSAPHDEMAALDAGWDDITS